MSATMSAASEITATTSESVTTTEMTRDKEGQWLVTAEMRAPGATPPFPTPASKRLRACAPRSAGSSGGVQQQTRSVPTSSSSLTLSSSEASGTEANGPCPREGAAAAVALDVPAPRNLKSLGGGTDAGGAVVLPLSAAAEATKTGCAESPRARRGDATLTLTVSLALAMAIVGGIAAPPTPGDLGSGGASNRLLRRRNRKQQGHRLTQSALGSLKQSHPCVRRHRATPQQLKQ